MDNVKFFQNKLKAEVDNYNALLQTENELQTQLREVHEERLAAFGKVQAVQQMIQELGLAEESVNASSNGHGDPELIAAVPSESQDAS